MELRFPIYQGIATRGQILTENDVKCGKMCRFVLLKNEGKITIIANELRT